MFYNRIIINNKIRKNEDAIFNLNYSIYVFLLTFKLKTDD